MLTYRLTIAILAFLYSVTPISGTKLTTGEVFEQPARGIVVTNSNFGYNIGATAIDRAETNTTPAPPPPDTTFTLPVVFHIISATPSAITDQQIKAGLQDLNDAFGKAGAYSASKGADTKIKFCLAQKDPDGGNTTGITRTTYFFGEDLNPDIEDDRLKNLIQWDPSQYINIWYVPTMHLPTFETYGCGHWQRGFVGGYATQPPNAGAKDGIVVTGFGVLLASCMGTYLSLLPTFNGGCNNNNCHTDGDQVCDTPPEDVYYSNSPDCNNPSNSCSTDTLSGFKKDVPDQKANFMDRGNQACQNEFTQGQATRMYRCILTQRSGLLANKCDPPCAANAVANFTRSNAYPLPGDNVVFTNNSFGAARYQWLVDGTPVSTNTNFSYNFATAGKYKITLKAYSTGATCYAAYTDYVTVTCGVTARFYTDKKTIASKYPLYVDSIRFTNTSTNATSFKWLMANNKSMTEQVVSTQKNFTYVFKNPANYTVRLIATNGNCTDTTETLTITTYDPTQDGVLYVTNVNCYQQTKLQVSFFVCNYGYATIPPGIPISFYDADPSTSNAHKLSPTFILPDSIQGLCCGYSYIQTIDVGKRGLNQLYAVFNDSGTTMPLHLPNTPMAEVNYDNNIQNLSGFQYKAFIKPPTAVMQPGDTLQLSANASHDYTQSYAWSADTGLSCINCANPFFIADTQNVTKQVVTTSGYGCTDTAYSTIKIPPYNDFSVTLDGVECAANDSVHVSFTLTNHFKRGVIPKGLSVAFYNGNPTAGNANLLPPVFFVQDTVAAKSASFSSVVQNIHIGSTIYAVVNDSGTTKPLKLPNTPFTESDYTNNITFAPYIRLKATAYPTQAILEPGDTLQMYANGSPGHTASYVWAPPLNLSCTHCDTTYLIADSNRVKQVTVTNDYGCIDTANVVVKVPPANDYTIVVNDIECAANDSLYVNFTLTNHFKRGVIPAGITVAWYKGDPTIGGATLLNPLFAVRDSVKAKQATFSAFIKSAGPGNVYAVVNDSGTTMPLVLPNVVHLPEKDYGNNITPYNYQPQQVLLQPADTTVLRKTSFVYRVLTPIIKPASTTWQTSTNYTLSCYNCDAPLATIFDNDTVIMHTANQFGCLIEGRSTVKILLPDMTVQLLHNDCYTNDSTLVFFKICMGNNYDTVFAALPVSFYDGTPSSPASHLLLPVFYTKQATANNCDTFFCSVASPATHTLYASVNDKGRAGSPLKAYDETDYANNTDVANTVPFVASIAPADTSVPYGTTLPLVIKATGKVSTELWQPAQYLTCTQCMATMVTPPYTVNYTAIVRNQYFCVDTAYTIIRTYRGTDINVPSAFTPNGDGFNDVFYVLAGKGAAIIKNFAVFNRWGNIVFQKSNVIPNTPANGWDGNIKGIRAEAGTYVYQLTMQFENGLEKTYKGTVVLVK